MYVILNEVKNLIASANYKNEILRLAPQNDIATQSPRRGERLYLSAIYAARVVLVCYLCARPLELRAN